MTASTLPPLRPLNLAQEVNEGNQVLEQVRTEITCPIVDKTPTSVDEGDVLGKGIPVRAKEDSLHPGAVIDEAHHHLMDSNTNDVASTNESTHECASDDEEWNRQVEEEWLRRKTYTPAQYLQVNLNNLSNILSRVDFPEREEAMRVIRGLQSLAGTYAREEEYRMRVKA
ncbi:MAG: hypothetical protein Q8O14_14755 [bacterium]|nr:hypothetical protein [bacterium]